MLGLAADQHTAFSSVLTPTTSGALAGLGVINGIVGTSLEYSILSGWTAANPSGGTLLASGSLTLGGVGYQLIDLATPVALTANQSIAVLLTYGTAGAAGVVVGGDGLYGVTQVSGSFSYPVNPGLSYYYDTNAATWTDFATKTYTVSGSTSSADTTGGVLFLKGVMVAPVPEPSTLALAAAGLGAALCTLRRRRGRLLGCAGLVVAVLAFTPAASAQQPVAIPLELQGNRLVIYVGVDNQPPYPYMFDSGSQIFEASQA
ncbi:MAG: PEP-CTERM sorting domain-containing protein, partial [Planctomycetia bacterium]|nr:PEP-CTERM sorting domain-containing protein [Planctomycetia bacterium]